MRLRLMGFTGLPAMCADRDHAFHRRHVRQLRRARHDIADRVNARLAGLLIRFTLMNPRSSSHLGAFQSDVFGIRLAADRHQQRFGFHLFRLPLASAAQKRDARGRFLTMLSTFAPVSTRMPVFLKTRSSSFEISSSSTGTRRGSISNTVTFVRNG